MKGWLRKMVVSTWRASWRAVRRAYWWTYHRTIKPFNVVRIRTLSPDYHDKDEIMLHMCFEILVRFVEREKPFCWWTGGKLEAVADNADLCQIEALYKWWTLERPKRYAPDGVKTGGDIVVLDPCEQSGYHMDSLWAREDQEKLLALVRVRERLWT